MSDLLSRALLPARGQASEILALIHEEEKARVRRWEEEKPSITRLVQSLTASYDIIKAERKKAKARLQELQAKIDKLQQAQQRYQGQQEGQQSQDLVDLQRSLVHLNNRVLDTDIQIKEATTMVAVSQRAEESEIHTSTLVALQDTKRLLQGEIAGLRVAIMRLDAKARLEAERQGAEDSGITAVTRLDEQLVKTASRLNRAKQQLYFPVSKGYRFSTGSSGVFFAARDLFISELSGRFDFDLELVPRPGGGKRVRITVNLGGAAGEGDGEAPPAPPSSLNRNGAGTSRPTGRVPRSGDSSSPSGSGGGAGLGTTSSGAGAATSSSTGVGQELDPSAAAAAAAAATAAATAAAAAAGTAAQPAIPIELSSRLAAAAAVAAAAAAAAAPPPLAPVRTRPESASTSADQAPFAAMAAAASAARGIAAAGTSRSSTPAPSAASAVPPGSPLGYGMGLPPLSSHDKPHKGDMVASFFTGLSKKKDKFKGMLTSSGGGGGAAGSAAAAAIPEAGESRSKLSKLAKAITHRADKLTDKITDKFKSSNSKLSNSRALSATSLDQIETLVTTGEEVLAVQTPSEEFGERGPDDAPPTLPLPPPPAPAPSADPGPSEPWDSDSLGMQAFEARPSRRGIYVQLLGEGVEVIGERGTKIPDLSMRELLLELEVSMNAVLEYDPLVGWQAPDKINLSIIQLNHKMRGSSLPLPSSIMRALLALYLPGVLTSTLVSILPTELGEYVRGSGEPVKASGELRVLGQQLSTYVASMAAPSASARLTPEQQAAAARARTLLGLSEGQALALAEIFGGRNTLLDKAVPLSVCELCRFYVKYSNSEMWPPLCNVFNKALQVCFDQLGVSERFTFGRFMDVAVARLARKPLRVSLTLQHLSATLNVDVGLATLRDFFERSVRELHKKAAEGGEEAALPKEPIEAQLENLALWHASTSQLIRTFKSRFRSMGCSLLAHADHDVFQLAAEGVHYDGPLKVRVPLDVLVDADNSLVWDVKLPDRDKNDTSMLAMLQETLRCLAVAQPEGSGAGGAEAGAGSLGTQLDQLLASTAAGGGGAAAGGDAGEGAGAGLPGGGVAGMFLRNSLVRGLEVPVLQSPVVGQVSMRRVVFALKLDEERMAELLSGAAGEEAGKRGAADSSAQTAAATDVNLAGQLLSCFGDLFTTSVDVGWRAEPEADGSNPCRCMLTVANNDITRVRADVESLMFQSSVSPKLAVRMLYAVVANIMLRFYNKDSFQLRFWYKLFSQLHEYLGKESLDVTACISAHAEVVRPKTVAKRQYGAGPEASAASASQVEPTLKVVINGGSSHQGLTQVTPFSLVNEINLLTVLDSYKLFDTTAS